MRSVIQNSQYRKEKKREEGKKEKDIGIFLMQFSILWYRNSQLRQENFSLTFLK